MLMVVLGAGASFDALKGAAVKPPLAAQLFQADAPYGALALQRFAGARSLVARMRQTAPVGGQVEAELGRFIAMAKATDDLNYRRDLIAIRYYVEFVISSAAGQLTSDASGVTNYLHLINRLYDLQLTQKKPVFFVSFNYDTLLEDAISSRFGYRFDSMSSYINSPFPVLKPHGSCNWVQHFPTLDRAPLVGVPMDDVEGQLRVADWADLWHGGEVEVRTGGVVGRPSSDFVLPALAVPAEGKDMFVCPELHLNSLRELVSQTTAILTIGWRASEQKFLELIDHQLAEVHRVKPIRTRIVTYGDDANAGQETARNLGRILNSTASGVNWHGFSAYVADSSNDGLNDLMRARR